MMVIEISIDNFTLHELHAFIKYTSSNYMKHDLLSFSFATDNMNDIFLRVLDCT